MHLRDALWRVDSAGGRAARRAGLACSSRAWAARRSADASPRAVLGAASCAGRCVLAMDYGSRPGSAGHAGAAARATRAAPRRRSRPTTPPRRPARRGSAATTGGPLAERARADGVAVVPLPGGFQPRARGRLLARHRARGRRRRAARRRRCATRSRRAAALAEELAAEWGPDAPRTARPSGSPARCTGRSRSSPAPGSTAPVALPLEVPGQRERRPARRSPASCRSPTTTRSTAGPALTAGFAPVFLEDPRPARARASRRSTSRPSWPRPARRPSSASAPAARRGSSAALARAARATSSRSTSPCCAGVDPVHIAAIDTLKARLAAA